MIINKKWFINIFDKIFGVQPQRKLNLYIVEDVIYYAKMLEINLENIGYENIKLFHNGEDVVNYLKINTTDCIILDHILSEDGLNGSDVLSFVNKNNPKVKVIILSGQENVEVAANMMKEGAYDYIIKNDMALFNLKNTLSRLEEFINEKEKAVWRDKRIKFLYIILIIILWILALVVFF
jgi:DNA-binding NtrC family response regulator